MRKSPHKFTLETFSSYMKSEGCVLLSKEYKGTRSCIEYKAKCGHRCKIWVSNFLSGRGRYCNKCKPKRKCRKLNIDTVRDILASRGCRLLSETFIDTYTPLEYVCQCGHTNKLPLYRIDRGQGLVCPSCSGSKKKSLQEVQSIFEKEGCKLLSTEYIWNRQKLSYIARCGHVHVIKASAFFSGEGRLCPTCQRQVTAEQHLKYSKEYQESLLASYGCRLIKEAKTTKDKAVYIAQCGHKTEMKISFFLEGYGHVCKKCYKKNTSLGELEIRKALDELGIQYIAQYPIKTRKEGTQRLDFFLPLVNVAIEFNGRQHYEYVSFFHGTGIKERKYGLEYAQEKDKRKKEWCEKHHIELIVIDGRKWSNKKIKKGYLKTFAKEMCIQRNLTMRDPLEKKGE